MNVYRTEGLGWLAGVFIALGGAIVVVNLLNLSVGPFIVLRALPVVFGFIVLATGVALLVAGILGGDDVD